MCTVCVIPLLFRQLFNNLISNSLKFTHQDKQTHIKIGSKNIEGSSIANNKFSPYSKY